MSQEAPIFTLLRLPYPWPPSEPILLLSSEANGLPFELVALNDGRLRLNTHNSQTSFISQPVDIQCDRPAWASLLITLRASHSSLELSGQTLLKDSPDVPRLLITSAQGLVPQQLSVDDPDSASACQTWIQNRRAKFGSPQPQRRNRRPKTIQEQARDLFASIQRLRHLQQLTLAGNIHLLGTLAGEMRASVYWRKGSDAKPDSQWNPLLLRMASLADLPLPVYRTPHITAPPILDEAVLHLTPSHAPRIERVFTTDQICDLQESLLTTVIRLGPAPGRVSSALELITEMAHTMGAAHYDNDASEFLDVLQTMKSEDADQATLLICQIADTLAGLSDWVLSELKKRNIIR